MTTISLVLPTRGRKPLVERFFQYLQKNTANIENVETILYIDDDDSASQHLNLPAINIIKIIGPQQTMGGYLTTCFKKATGDIIFLVNDDIIIRTPGWDKQIIEIDNKFFDKVYLGYPNDLFKGITHPTFPILSRTTCELLIDPFPKEYNGAFIDTHLLDIFKRLEHSQLNRLIYLDDVVFEHVHYRTGRAEFDETYRKRDRLGDDPIFIALTKQRDIAAKRLIAYIKNEKLPEYQYPILKKTRPTSLFSMPFFFTKIFLIDNSISWKYRLSLFIKFCKRYVASISWVRKWILKI